MRGRDIGQPTAFDLREGGGIQSLAIHRDPTQLGASHGEGMAGGAVAGVFQRHAITRLHQQLGAEADALLRTAGNHHLGRIAVQPAAAAQVGRYQFAQGRLTRRVAIAQARRRWLAPETRREPRPGFEGEQIEGRHADAKGTRRTAHGERKVIALQAQQRLGRHYPGSRRLHQRPRAAEFHHVGAIAYPAFDVALGVELIERPGNGVA